MKHLCPIFLRQSCRGYSPLWLHEITTYWWLVQSPDKSLSFLSLSLYTLLETCMFMYYIPSWHKILIELSKHSVKIISVSILWSRCFLFSDSLPLAYIRMLTWMGPSSLSSLVAVLNLTKRCFHSGHSPGLSRGKFVGGLNFVMAPLIPHFHFWHHVNNGEGGFLQFNSSLQWKRQAAGKDTGTLLRICKIS